MAAAVRSEEQFLCSICLDIFSEPVSTPCGHNFCKGCITQSWTDKEVCLCPLCKRSYNTRPELHINTFIQEMVSEFKQQQKSQTVDDLTEVTEVTCDYCTDPKLKATKSCLVCLFSYCETHLQPHLTVPRLKSHQLMEPVDNMEDRMCQQHHKPLELFCRSEDSCLCTMCALLEHKNHKFVSLKEESDQKRSLLQKTQTESQEMVEQRRQKIQEVQQCLELRQKEVETEKFTGNKAFTDLIQSVQRSQDQFLEKLHEKQKQIQKQAEDLVEQLEQEICELEQRSSEAEKLQRTGDNLYFLQHFTALAPPAGLKEWSSAATELDTCEGSVTRAFSELEKSLSGEFKQMPSRLELYKAQQFAVEVTLDPDALNPDADLSPPKDHCDDVKNEIPVTSETLSKSPKVLGKQIFSSGSFYFEVQVKEKIEWTLGVAKESVNRKQKITVSPERGFWTICLRNGEYKACAYRWISLFLKSTPQKVGVFVDYDKSLVSFYDVDSADLLHSFTSCSFTESLVPYFDPCVSAPETTITPQVITASETVTTTTCSTDSGIFGQSKAATSTCSSLGHQVTTVPSQGFGSFSTPTKSDCFGTAPAFGSSTASGVGRSFGTASSFSSPFGSFGGSEYMQGTAASGMGGFGFGSSSSAPTFGGLSNQSGFLLGSQVQGSGFGSFLGFGQQQQSGGFSFGSSNQSSSTFGGWKS